jgi:hypothetical protein
MAFAVLRFPHNLRWIFSLHKKHIRTHDTTGVDVFRFIIVNTCLVDYNDLRATKTLSFFGRSKAFLSFGWDARFGYCRLVAGGLLRFETKVWGALNKTCKYRERTNYV